MSAVIAAAVAFACIGGAALLGNLFQGLVPREHLTGATKDAVNLTMGLIATMTALILGLLIASAQSDFETRKNEMLQMAAKISHLDRELGNYGGDTAAARILVRTIVERMITKLWGTDPSDRLDEPTGFRSEQLYDSIQQLAPRTELQRSLKSHMLTDVIDLGETRWLLYEQSDISSISTTLLVSVIAWLTVLFLSFALFAPRNATVTISLLIGALSVSAAILLLLDLDRPFDGLIQIPNEPMRRMLSNLGK